METAASLGDHVSRLPALLLAVRLRNDPRTITEAKRIAAENSLKREHLLLTFERIEHVLETNEQETAQTLYQSVESDAAALDEDIEMPRMTILSAEVLLEQGKHDDAVRRLDKGLTRARTAGLAPELAAGLALRAKLEIEQRAYETGYVTSRQALQVFKQLAENISNENDRAIFLNRRSVQNLMTEIRRLGKILGQKQRAE